jgi:hypothetical protein
MVEELSEIYTGELRNLYTQIAHLKRQQQIYDEILKPLDPLFTREGMDRETGLRNLALWGERAVRNPAEHIVDFARRYAVDLRDLSRPRNPNAFHAAIKIWLIVCAVHSLDVWSEAWVLPRLVALALIVLPACLTVLCLKWLYMPYWMRAVALIGGVGAYYLLVNLPMAGVRGRDRSGAARALEVDYQRPRYRTD